VLLLKLDQIFIILMILLGVQGALELGFVDAEILWYEHQKNQFLISYRQMVDQPSREDSTIVLYNEFLINQICSRFLGQSVIEIEDGLGRFVCRSF